MQCHLETTSGRIPAVLQRFERGTFACTGQPLAEFRFVRPRAGTGHESKFEAVLGIPSRQSRCFRERRKAGVRNATIRTDSAWRGSVRHYSNVCRRCHSSSHPAGAASTAPDCITCHMPKRRAEDAPHVIMTDHLIQRRAPVNALVAFAERPAEDYRGEVAPYYPAPFARYATERSVPRGGAGGAVQQLGGRTAGAGEADR